MQWQTSDHRNASASDSNDQAKTDPATENAVKVLRTLNMKVRPRQMDTSVQSANNQHAIALHDTTRNPKVKPPRPLVVNSQHAAQPFVSAKDMAALGRYRAARTSEGREGL